MTNMEPQPPEPELQLIGLDRCSRAIDEQGIGTTVMLATALINVQVGMKIHSCRAMCDPGSQLNLITEECVQRIGARLRRCNRAVSGIGNKAGVALSRSAVISMCTWNHNRYVISAEFTVINELLNQLPDRPLPGLSIPEGVVLADPEYNLPAKVDMLLGAEIWASTIRAGVYRSRIGTLLQETEFGYVILGKFPEEQLGKLVSAAIRTEQEQMEDSALMKLDATLRSFWELEELTTKRMRSHQEELAEQIFVQNHKRMPDGRYQVDIPIRPDAPPLGDSRDIAVKRFLWMEKRLDRDAALKEQYVDFLREYEELGHMQAATRPPEPGALVYYIPHHCVTTKFRVVFDASCRTTTGKSFNDIQLVGEKLQHDLADVIARFRRHKIAISADIKKMFRQVRVNPKQWDAQRIIWREQRHQPLREYWLKVVTYGMSSSVHNSVRAMQQCAIDHEQEFPRAAQVVREDFYVDDCFTGADTSEEASQLCHDMDSLLKKGGFELCKWASNDRAVIEIVTCAEEIVELDEQEDTKVLGLRWITSTDELTFRVVQMEVPERPSKRQVLSTIAKLYDPNGYLAPVIITAKIIMQDLWRLEINWDESIPSELCKRWSDFYSSLEQLRVVKVPRWLGTQRESRIQLHGFADASSKAYGAVIYTRITNEDGTGRCQLLVSKSRVAPTSVVSIPRLELAAAELLGRLMRRAVETCQFEQSERYFWTDSMVVLHWLAKQPCDLKVFVANRVASIQNNTYVHTWAHVKSEDNPADLVSRGMSMSDFVESKFWLQGPVWLVHEQEHWPESKLRLTDQLSEQFIGELRTMQPETLVSYGAIGHKDGSLLYEYENWNKIMRLTAYVLRFVQNCRVKASEQIKSIRRATYTSHCEASNEHEPTVEMLAHEELRGAINHWAKAAQAQHYGKEIACRQNQEPMPEKSAIAGLNPILDQKGVLCVGGRLSATKQVHHQIIIPAASRLGWLLLNRAHRATLHGGVQAMIAYVRTGFWIPQLRSEARKYIKGCTTCRRMAAETAEQMMGNLPADRVRPARPFYKTGVDFAGPFDVRMGPGRPRLRSDKSISTQKGYVAVFVCLVTRAVHLEAVMSMTSEAFIAAFKRFVARRGHCAYMYSDNGTNFVGADRLMQEAIVTWRDQNTLDFVQAKGTVWRFITPAAPFQGGIWEAAVKSMKHHLRRVMGVQKYSYEGLATLLAEIEACMNSRPICAMSDDKDDMRALTPAHFLIGEELILPIPISHGEPPRGLKELWKVQEQLVQDFWQQWSADYLHTLQQRKKWKMERENVRTGQLVILKNENLPPSQWALGRIIAIHPGEDGLVRNVTILVADKEYQRPVQKLCIMPTDHELEYWQ